MLAGAVGARRKESFQRRIRMGATLATIADGMAQAIYEALGIDPAPGGRPP